LRLGSLRTFHQLSSFAPREPLTVGSAISIVCRFVHLNLCTPICHELTDHTRLSTFQQLSSTDPSTQLTVTLYEFPQWVQNTTSQNNTRQSRVEHLFSVSIHNSEMPINLCRTRTWLVQGLIPGAKQVALGTIAHSQPKEDNGRITTVSFWDGTSI
jgi:hypothetical protein